MKPETPKIAILESLSELDNIQAEKVLGFVKSILSKSGDEGHGTFKERAMREIRLALKMSKDGLEFNY